VQAYGSEEQTDDNLESRINDGDLDADGQLWFSKRTNRNFLELLSNGAVDHPAATPLVIYEDCCWNFFCILLQLGGFVAICFGDDSKEVRDRSRISSHLSKNETQPQTGSAGWCDLSIKTWRLLRLFRGQVLGGRRAQSTE